MRWSGTGIGADLVDQFIKLSIKPGSGTEPEIGGIKRERLRAKRAAKERQATERLVKQDST
jgi:hypothetical protein